MTAEKRISLNSIFIGKSQPKQYLVITEDQGKGDEHKPGDSHNLRQTEANQKKEKNQGDYNDMALSVFDPCQWLCTPQ